jgi:hypothetical protein
MTSSVLGGSPTSEAINGQELIQQAGHRSVSVQGLRNGDDVVQGRQSAQVEGSRT